MAHAGTDIVEKIGKSSKLGMWEGLASLFATPPSHVAVESVKDLEVSPMAPLATSRQLEFNIIGNENYIDLQSMELEVEFQIRREDNTVLVREDFDRYKITCAPNMLDSLFSKCDVYLGETLISKSGDGYPYIAYIQNLLETSSGQKDEILQTVGYYQDTAGKHDKLDDPANANAIMRRQLIESGTVNLRGPLHFDLVHSSNRPLINNINMRILLTRSKDEWYLMTNETREKFKVVLTKAVLCVETLKLAPSLMLAHGQMMANKHNCKYPVTLTDLKYFNVPAGSDPRISIENIFNGKIPHRVFVFCMDSDGFSGSLKKNPFNFTLNELRSIQIFVNSTPYSMSPLTFNLESKQYARLYRHFQRSLCQPDSGKAIGVDYESYPKGFLVIPFILSNDRTYSNQYISGLTRGTCRLELTLSQNINRNITIGIYAQFKNMLEITEAREITYDYSI
jgi:hypothetical protein